MSKVLIGWLAVLFVFVGSGLFWVAMNRQVPAEPEQVVVPKEVAIGEFELTERSGRTFHSKDLDGHVWLVNFFFASCPNSCHQQSLVVQGLHNEYADKGIKFVSVTVDPATDTPERLREYARQFGAGDESWLFLTGDMQYIRRIGVETFQLFVDEKTHVDRFVLVDRQGEIAGVFNWHEEREMKTLRRKMMELQGEQTDAAEGPDAA